MERDAQDASPAETVGRESELARLRTFLLGETRTRAMVIVGPPGVGKTTLWDAGLAAGRDDGMRTLSARAAEAEAHLPFTTLSDLVGDLDLAAFPDMPSPQRQALEIALLRADPGEQPPAPRATALAVLHVFRSLAAEAPMVVAIDDIQWADSVSIGAIAFALRRLEGGRVRFLATRRPGRATTVEAAIGPHLTEEIPVEGLTLGAIRHLLATRLGLALSRRALRQLHHTTMGYPYFALELGREFQEHGPPAIGDELHLPDSLDTLLEASVARRPDAARALLAVALYGSAPPSILVAVAGEATVDAAVDAELLVRDGGSLRPAHPLLAAAAIKGASAAERRALHRSLAGISGDPVRRARHLAAATTTGPDRDLAAVVDAGVAAARGRGAMLEAIELAEHALRLTPPDDPARDDRILYLGEDLSRADELPRMRQLLTKEFDTLSPGPARARGHLLLAAAAPSQEHYERHLEAAINASADAPMERALALATQARDHAVSFLERLDDAEAKAMGAISLAAHGEGRAQAIYALSWVRILRGQPIDDLRPSSPAEASTDTRFAHARMEGIRLAFRGCLAEARTILDAGRQQAEDLGQDWAHGAYVMQLAEVALRSGDLRTAERWIVEHEGIEESFSVGLRSNVARLRAAAAAVKGDAETAETWVAAALRLVTGQRWDILELDRVRGLAALAAGRPDHAIPPLLRVWRHTVSEGIDDPGAFPVAPDLAEAALATGDSALADEVIDRLAHHSGEQEHPWGLASVRRCEALRALTRDVGSAAARAMMLAAVDEYEKLGCRFDAARSLLALGRQARRGRKWAAAREALSRAVEIFDELGCDGWSAVAQGLLDGLGGRRPAADGTLTPSERRVVELASQGLSNREIAASLYVSEHTVEVHLAHAYPKLGVTSRTQLAAAMRPKI